MRFLFLIAAFFTIKISSISGAQETFSDCKRIIILGEGVTGTWAAAKIVSHLNSSDELWIVVPPQEDLVKNLGEGVFSHYTTSAFIPIGIQTEMGVINLEPPSHDDVEKAKEAKDFDLNSKLYISPDLDFRTQRKLDQYISKASKDHSVILMHYHRDVCYKEWQKYIKEGGKGADFEGTVILSENSQALENLRKKILNNRLMAGYSTSDDDLHVLGIEETSTLLPRYCQMIKAKKLNGLFGLSYEGRVKSSQVFETLNDKIEMGSAKIRRIRGWVESLQTEENDQGKLIVTGVKLRSGEVLEADVVVTALGQGAEKVLKTAQLHLPILKKWGVVYSLSQDQKTEEPPTIIMRGLGIVREVANLPINCGLGEWILPEGIEPGAHQVRRFVEQSAMIWEQIPSFQKRKLLSPIYVQPRPMTLDGLPVLDSQTPGLIVLNPSGSQGNTQAPGSALFAASKVLEQLGREIPPDLKLTESVNWKAFELERFK